MRTVVGRRRGTRLALAASALVLGPVLLAAPAHAESTSPTPIASEPRGGATCLPGTAAGCGQDQGVSATPTATPTPTPPPVFARLGRVPPVTGMVLTSDDEAIGVAEAFVGVGVGVGVAVGVALGWGYAGTGLLLGGSMLVLAGRRPGRAAR